MDNSNQWRKRMARGVMTLMFAAVPMQGMFAQVTLNTPNTTLGVVIKKIQAQSEFKFFYDDDLSDMRVKAINVKDAALEKVLAQLLKDKGVTFKVDDKVVYLKRAQLPRQQTRRGGEKRKITGRILDENGEPLIGASVTIKGTTDRAVTDMDGNYTVMTDAENPVAQFTYLGYKPQEIVAGKNSVVNAMMVLDSQSIDEVVVTALGIKREKKMLGYSVQDIKSDALNTTGDPSVTGALEGKVAGLQMNTASTGLGGSTKITIRGNSSLTDNNQPLWIVDGVPFTDDQTSDASAYGGYDRGGTSFDINPEDIESVSVLKGPNAAALYGSRAGNGVILVTTKKGSHKQGFGISYSGNFTWSEAAETIKMQKKYGQGSNGKTVYIYDDENNPTALTGELSFGPALDGHLEPSWLGEKIPYKYYGDKLKDYFKTGFSQFHTVALGNTTEKSHFRVSVGFNGNYSTDYSFAGTTTAASADGAYVLSPDGTSFRRVEGSYQTSPFRAVMIANSDEAAAVSVLTVGGNVSTSISAVESEALDGQPVYNLSGVRVGTYDASSGLGTLPRGVYIVGGKKLVR